MLTYALTLAAGFSNASIDVPTDGSEPRVPVQLAGSQRPSSGGLHGLIAIFDFVCLRTFPNEQALDGLNRVPGMRAMTSEEVRSYLKDDPGRGWLSSDGPSPIAVTIEAPPIHTCAVRMPTADGVIDELKWKEVVALAEGRAGGRFVTMKPSVHETGGISIHVIGDQRQNPDGSAEAFYLIRSGTSQKRAGPEAAVEIRLVHQMAKAR